MHKIAKEWSDAGSMSDAVHLTELLINEHRHIPSMVWLAKEFIKINAPESALDLFDKAAIEGPHHESIYNAGQLMADQKDFLGALRYFQAAARLHLTDPEHADEAITKLSEEAFDSVSRSLALKERPLKESVDAFIVGSILDLPEEIEDLWHDGVVAALFKQGHQLDMTSLQEAGVALEGINFSKESQYLSDLQWHILSELLIDVALAASEQNEHFLKVAATFMELLATKSRYCFEDYNDSENEPGCFNNAITEALSIYRKHGGVNGDENMAQRLLDLAASHPMS